MMLHSLLAMSLSKRQKKEEENTTGVPCGSRAKIFKGTT